jgi:TrmH family RNA methyltransferase
MDTEIVSVQNSRVKEWVQLLERRGRDKQGKYIIEGMHLVDEAVKANAPIDTIVYSLDKGKPRNITEAAGNLECEWVGVSQAIMEKCSDTQTPQGIFAVVDKFNPSAELFMSQSHSLVVVVDGVQDPGNLGTIIRSADAVGADGVILGAGTVDLYNPKTIRSTMGSLFHLPIIEGELMEILPIAQEKGISLVTTSLQAKHSCYETDLRKPTWLIVGNEGKGVSAEIAALANVHIIIPMKGKAESLNVAMATTILLFEAARQRML